MQKRPNKLTLKILKDIYEYGNSKPVLALMIAINERPRTLHNQLLEMEDQKLIKWTGSRGFVRHSSEISITDLGKNVYEEHLLKNTPLKNIPESDKEELSLILTVAQAVRNKDKDKLIKMQGKYPDNIISKVIQKLTAEQAKYLAEVWKKD